MLAGVARWFFFSEHKTSTKKRCLHSFMVQHLLRLKSSTFSFRLNLVTKNMLRGIEWINQSPVSRKTNKRKAAETSTRARSDNRQFEFSKKDLIISDHHHIIALALLCFPASHGILASNLPLIHLMLWQCNFYTIERLRRSTKIFNFFGREFFFFVSIRRRRTSASGERDWGAQHIEWVVILSFFVLKNANN